MAQKRALRVNIVSDMVCPWCCVLRKKLQMAMDRFPDVDFQIEWQAFFLNPNLPTEGVDKIQYFNSKFGKERTQAMMAQMSQLMASLGIPFQAGGLTSNTIDAHRMSCLAKRCGKQDQLMQVFFRKYFSEAQCLGDPQVLIAAAHEVGIPDPEQVIEKSCRMMPELQQEIMESKKVRGVPQITIGGCITLNGAQEPDVLANAIEECLSRGESLSSDSQVISSDIGCRS